MIVISVTELSSHDDFFKLRGQMFTFEKSIVIWKRTVKIEQISLWKFKINGYDI